MKSTGFIMFLFAAMSVHAAFEMDKSVMSEGYWKIWNDRVQSKIDADIEKYRKVDAVVELSAADGADVSVEQMTHAFYFGANIFNYNQLGTKERNDRYKNLFGTLFNSGTVAFYWQPIEPFPYQLRFDQRYEDTELFWNACSNPSEQPHWRRPPPDQVVSHLKARGCRIHGHPLVWGNLSQMPRWIWDEFCPESEKEALELRVGVKIPRRNTSLPLGRKDVEFINSWSKAWKLVFSKLTEREVADLVPSFVKAFDEAIERRIRTIGERYGSRIDSWDVVNESASDWAHNAKRAWPKGESAAKNSQPLTISQHYGVMPANYAYRSLQLAQKYMRSDAWLNINEYNMEAFPGQIRDLNASGVDFQIVGSQMHLFNPAESKAIAAGEFTDEVKTKLSPDGIWDTFAKVAAAGGGRPIHLSEVTITAPDDTPKGQMIQAIIMRNAYRIWFSIEKMNGITWWNVVDDCGYAGEPLKSGIFTRDMKPKAACFAMDDLVNREWKTRLTIKANDGKISFRGFRGRYRLTWNNADGTTAVKEIMVK